MSAHSCSNMHRIASLSNQREPSFHISFVVKFKKGKGEGGCWLRVLEKIVRERSRNLILHQVLMGYS